MNHALGVLAAERGSGDVDDIIAVLDCDHVPLPHFLTATLGWFADPAVGLVQGPQNFYNAGAFDDDGAARDGPRTGCPATVRGLSLTPRRGPRLCDPFVAHGPRRTCAVVA